MYLNIPEKRRLCKIIHNILQKRGGYWITADIYVKNQLPKLDLKIDRKTKDFFERHRIEENKFERFDAAETFLKWSNPL
jgi:hypothetical protein